MEDKEIEESNQKSKSPKEIILKQRQDLMLLKRAVLTFREEREKELKEEKEYEERVAVLELSVSEKDSILSLLEQDILDLEYKLESIQPKMNEIESSSSDSTDEYYTNNIIPFETLNKKLTEDCHNSAILYNEMCAAKQAKLKDLDIKRRAVACMDQTLSQKVNQKSLELFELTRQVEIVTKELEDTQQLNADLTALNTKHKEELISSKFTCMQVMREKDNIENKLLELIKSIPDLQYKLMTQGENSALLSAKLVQLKQKVSNIQMAEAKQYYQRFSAFVNMKGFSDKTDLIFRRDHNGEFIFIIQNSKGIIRNKIRNIDSVFIHPTKSNTFIIRLIGDETKEFEAENPEEIVKEIRQFILKVFQTPTN